MGVPKFYRWISERYPLINQMLSSGTLLPEIDNFYLDMNGIIHACTHPNDAGDTSAKIPFRDMILGIFRYIDRIVTEIVKPKKVLFMAIDGVAPRAKLNQQRSRRFRAAQDRVEGFKAAIAKGEHVNEEDMFDSNCITPGTEFMDLVGKHIRWFIRKKISEDPLWQNLDIIFSGHDVPGEGEHKIMEYIRNCRNSPNYQPNVRHCMYGQDADLIMLGLCTHEPHFALLREVVNFTAGFKNNTTRTTVIRQNRDAQFQLMHLSVLREYISLDLGLDISWQIDPERLIDDFIFLTFLVGNDFLPHLPTLDISEHAFDTIIDAYKVVLKEKAHGYIIENGEITDFGQLSRIFEIIGDQEFEILENRDQEMKDMANKKYRKPNVMSAAELQIHEQNNQNHFETALKKSLAEDGIQGKPEIGKKDFRGRYYFEKFNVIVDSASGAREMEGVYRSYLEGLVWCLSYYTKGCVSWTWFYPYHYGPMLQDMKEITRLASASTVSFNLGKPFYPFQQLLGCLPPASRKLLPNAYQWLMVSAESPILQFYPETFELDIGFKKNPWEAVVKLPFIDEVLLKETEAKYCPSSKLSREEAARDKFGVIHVYKYDVTVSEKLPSISPELGLPDIYNCRSSVTTTDFAIEPGAFFKAKWIEGTIVPLAGFPTLGVFRMDRCELEYFKINVFGMDSRYRSLVLSLRSPNAFPNGFDLKVLIGRHIFVNYPLMTEAKIVAISTYQGEYKVTTGNEVTFMAYTKTESELWTNASNHERKAYLKGRGIPGTGGLQLEDIGARIRVVILQGMSTDPVTGARKKIFGTQEVEVPLQLTLWGLSYTDLRFKETSEVPVSHLFPLQSEVLCLKGPMAGSKGKVVGPHKPNDPPKPASKERRVVDVEFRVSRDMPFQQLVASCVKEEEFVPLKDLVNATGISGNVLGRLVGSLLVNAADGKNGTKYDIGLDLKCKGKYQLLGYARQVERVNSTSAWTTGDSVTLIGIGSNGEDEVENESVAWEYSKKVIPILKDYKDKFPQVLKNISKANEATLSLQTVTENCPGAPAAVMESILEWLKSQEFYNLPRSPLSTEALPKDAIKVIETAMNRLVGARANEEPVMKTFRLPVEHLFRANTLSAVDAPLTFNNEPPVLGDRIANVATPSVPFGMKGVVVAIHGKTGFVDVVFDEEFIGGKNLQGNCSQFRGRLCPWSSLIKISDPLGAVKATPSSASVPASSGPALPEAKQADSKPSEVIGQAPSELGNFRIMKKTAAPTPAPAAASATTIPPPPPPLVQQANVPPPPPPMPAPQVPQQVAPPLPPQPTTWVSHVPAKSTVSVSSIVSEVEKQNPGVTSSGRNFLASVLAQSDNIDDMARSEATRDPFQIPVTSGMEGFSPFLPLRPAAPVRVVPQTQTKPDEEVDNELLRGLGSIKIKRSTSPRPETRASESEQKPEQPSFDILSKLKPKSRPRPQQEGSNAEAAVASESAAPASSSSE